jgi:hypothetical protein
VGVILPLGVDGLEAGGRVRNGAATVTIFMI